VPATPIDSLPGLATLDTDFICGTSNGTNDSTRIDGLENGVTYRIVMVAIDRAGNPNAIDLGEVTPTPVTDFWEQYKNRGGQAEGCQSSPLGSLGGGLIVLAGLLLFTRRRRHGAGLLVLALLFSASTPAIAQPYWEELDEGLENDSTPDTVHWNFGLKFGPYKPDIDSEFDASPGPWEETFGNGLGFMSQAELDYYFLWPMGQLGATASVGFSTRKAKALLTDAGGNPIVDPMDPDSVLRSDGDSTSFRIIPVTLGAVYRFTELDDRYRIPIVPYGKLSLAYYLWRITQPNGSSAETPTADCQAPATDDCKGSLAKNGTWGWVGAIGVAVRLERLDGELALREAGIEHAGLYAELSFAQVDGLGADRRLAVGDFTWFAGINFEF
jgi:hypothetical protein